MLSKTSSNKLLHNFTPSSLYSISNAFDGGGAHVTNCHTGAITIEPMRNRTFFS